MVDMVQVGMCFVRAWVWGGVWGFHWQLFGGQLYTSGHITNIHHWIIESSMCTYIQNRLTGDQPDKGDRSSELSPQHVQFASGPIWNVTEATTIPQSHTLMFPHARPVMGLVRSIEWVTTWAWSVHVVQTGICLVRALGGGGVGFSADAEPTHKHATHSHTCAIIATCIRTCIHHMYIAT